MSTFVEAEVRQQIDRRLAAKGWVLDPSHPNRDVFLERAVVDRLAKIPRRRLKNLAPDYTFFVDGAPIAILEAKKPRASIRHALDQGLDYAKRIGVDFVFACNGPTFKSLHAPSGKPLYLNSVEVTEPLAPSRLRRFWDDQTNNVVTVPDRVIKSRVELIIIFERLNSVLRQAGIRAGLERFTEFANILFLKLASEMDPDDRIWNELLKKKTENLPGYLNDYVVKYLRKRYRSDVLSKTSVEGDALKTIVQELTPLHLISVDEDLKGVAFEHFLSRTTSSNNDLGEYFTPRPVVRFMVQLLNPEFGQTVFDPFCGTGGFLTEAFRHLSQQASHSKQATKILHQQSLYGREITTTARVAKMNMILFGDGHSGVVQGDSLSHLDTDDRYDCVLSNIPFSLQVDSDALRAVDADAKDADQACLLRCFNSLKGGGGMAVVLPEGLVVNRSHRDLWSRLFRESRVRVIATLPRGSFAPYTEAGTKVLYLTDKGQRGTDWYYQATISGPKAKGRSIDMDEFLFFFQATDGPADECPAGVEVIKVSNGRIERPWSIDNDDVVPLHEVATISNGTMLTKAKATLGLIPVIGGGHAPSCYHNAANTEGPCFTVSKSGAYAGYVWWHEYPVWASDCLVVKSRSEDEFLTFYLFLCLKTKQEEIYSRQQGTGQPHIFREHLLNLPVPRLPIEEQRQWACQAQDAIQQRMDAVRHESSALKEAVAAIDDIYKGADMKPRNSRSLR